MCVQKSGHGCASAVGALIADGGGAIFPWHAGRDSSFSRGRSFSPAVAALLNSARAPSSTTVRDQSPEGRCSASLPSVYIDTSDPDVGGEHAERASSGGTAVERDHLHTRGASSNSGVGQQAGLNSLTLRSCRATEAGMRALFAGSAQCSRSLTTLDVSGCRGVSLAFLSVLPYGCPLAILLADGCPAVRRVNATLPDHSALRKLSVMRCPNLTTVVLAAPALQECRVSQSMQLEQVTLVAPQLQCLHAVHCRNVNVLQLGSVPKLVELNLMGTSKLPGPAIATAAAASNTLKICNLADCLLLASLIVPGVSTRAPGPLRLTDCSNAQHAASTTVCVPCMVL